MPVDVEIKGIAELTDRLEAMGLKTNAVISPILKNAVKPILNDMKETTAFKDKPGEFLRKSLKISGVKTKYGIKYVRVGDIDGVAKYSWYVEKGHSNGKGKGSTPAHPFMRPAYQNHKDEVKKLIKEGIQEALK